MAKIKRLLYNLSLTFLFILLFLVPSFSNDGHMEVTGSRVLINDGHLEITGGRVLMINGNSTSIKMESEVVKIEMFDKYYIVDATFEFFNYGDTDTVLVGFPKLSEARGEVFEFEDFRTWVNDDIVNCNYIPSSLSLVGMEGVGRDSVITKIEEIKFWKDEINKRPWPGGVFILETGWYTKKVVFEKNKGTTTMVKYKTSYGYTASVPYLEYIYGTGRSWKDNIGKSTFKIKNSANKDGALPRLRDRANPSHINNAGRKIPELIRTGLSEYKFVLSDFEPEKNEVLRIPLKPYSRPWETNNEGDYHFDYKDTMVLDDLLDILTPKQLRLFRNQYFAIHGKIFEKYDLKEYFNEFKNTKLDRDYPWLWYKPRKDFKESDLTDIQSANVKKIRAYENKIRKMYSKDKK